VSGSVSGGRAMRIGRMSRAAFAAILVFLGILSLVQRDFAAGLGPVPDGAPARTILLSVSALVSLACGAGLLVPRAAAASARVLLAWLLLWLLAVRVPYFFLVSHAVDGWYPICEILVLTAAAWILFAELAAETDRRRPGFAASDAGARVARALYGLALIPFGLAHFLYLEATAPLVPEWLPWHVAWAYLTGAAFIAAGAAILIGVWARLAAVLSALQMGLFALLVWVPRAAAGTLSDFQKGEFVATLALTAAGWVVADSYRGIPWLAARAGAGRRREGRAAA
jgi:uncharacterized membrane protein